MKKDNTMFCGLKYDRNIISISIKPMHNTLLNRAQMISLPKTDIPINEV